MAYVLGVDLGTSAVKVLLVDEQGTVASEASRGYPLYHDEPGWSEQEPEDWVEKTIEAVAEAVRDVDPEQVKGISFSGQMHGLVLIDEAGAPLRRAILWNDTRTSEQCRKIETELTIDTLHRITKNPALEGFTLPKLLWVQEYEPDLFKQAAAFLLPKDYVRFRLTGELGMDYSDAAGTLLLDVADREWSRTVADAFQLDTSLFPPLLESHAEAGTLLPEMQEQTGLGSVPLFAGGADNACGALGTGILQEGSVLSSTGTSGVMLAFEEDGSKDFSGSVHYFNHAVPNAYYTMGVTLAAGHSLSWFKEQLAPDRSFEELLALAEASPAGSRGLLFTPYISGERTPHPDADIRGSFIGLHTSHTLGDMTRAVLEGITFSLNESLQLFREQGKQVHTIIASGGGAKSRLWLQMQADIFGAATERLESEQGPGLGAAMIAAYGLGWTDSYKELSDRFTKSADRCEPDPEAAAVYAGLFPIYQKVYRATEELSRALKPFRQAGSRQGAETTS
ncbi:xylulokinase [Alkalicoccus luteus]|uniref:xylulokinase n=1 Tax=Alkalicoccus luteus TaxID=1237094 RepID=UPI0040339462